MFRLRSAVAALLFLAAAAAMVASVSPSAGAAGEGTSEELETNRRLLERYRADPEQYARLKREWSAFMALPAAHRERLRKIDEELHALDPATLARLWTILDRYVSWRERLPEADRHRIDTAADSEERLQIVRELRDREWIARLPRVVRERVQNTPEGEERAALLVQLRKQDRDRRAEWQRVLRLREEVLPPRFRPSRLQQFSPEVQAFVEKSLLPALTEEEQKRLQAVEGMWPAYARTLAQMADRHPIVLPPVDTPGVRRAEELPADFRRGLQEKLTDPQLRALQRAEGTWPAYALAIVDAAGQHHISLPAQPLGPATPEQYTAAVQELIRQLGQDAEAAQALQKARGRWPEYPRTIVQLARDRGLKVPGTSLPGPPEMWDRLKAALPPVPDRTLRNFLLLELTAEDRERLRLSLDDAASRQRLEAEYYARHPGALLRARSSDPPARSGKGKKDTGRP